MKYTLPLTLIFCFVFCLGVLAQEEATQQQEQEVDQVLLSMSKPGRIETRRLIDYLGDRHATIREAAVRRLSLFPDRAGKQVIETLMTGNLSAKLAAREILAEWKIDVDTIDPWRSETLTEAAREAMLSQLATLVKASDEEKGDDDKDDSQENSDTLKKLTETQLAEASASLDRMLRVESDDEVKAIRERLYRLGPALLNEVRTRLKEATADRDYERLTTLRYRLASSPSLPLRWPGGLERLASNDSKISRKAAEELIGKLGQGDQPLMVELFANPDSMIREISLKGLQQLGNQDSLEALTRLLDDPEPNVRAAILKMATESPSPGFVQEIVKYLEKETDADLLVHGIRVLKEAEGEKAARVLIKMLQHDSWQVRAEAAAALGSFCEDSNYNHYSDMSQMSPLEQKAQQLTVDIYVALLKQLKDTDPFVISKIIKSLEDVDMEVAVEPLVGVIERQPELAERIIATLANGKKMIVKSKPHLERFAKHEKPALRSAALSALLKLQPSKSEEYIMAGLQDNDEKVRLTVLKRLAGMTRESLLTQTQKIYDRYYKEQEFQGSIGDPRVVFASPVAEKSGISKFFSGFAKAVVKAAKTTSQANKESFEPATEAEAVAPSAVEAVGIPDSIAPVAVPEVNQEDAKSLPVPEVAREDAKANLVSEVVREDAKTLSVPEWKPVAPDFQPEDATEVAAIPAPAEEADPSNKSTAFEDYHRWIVEYGQGKGRAEWLEKTVPLLEKSLNSDSAEERVLAAQILIAFGRQDASLITLLETMEKTFGGSNADPEDASNTQKTASRGDIFEHAVKALPWLSLERRREVYWKLKEYAKSGELIRTLLSGASTPLDPVIVEEMWNWFVDDPSQGNNKEEHAFYREYHLPSLLQAAIFPEQDSGFPMNNGQPISGLTKADARRMLEHQLVAGNEKQRLLAFILFARDDNEKAIQKADAWLVDETLSPDFRNNVFKLTLCLLPKTTAQARAVQMLEKKDASEEQMKSSLRFLALGKNALQRALPFSSLFSYEYISYSSNGKPIIPELPKGVTFELVKPFLDHKDPEVAAMAGYLTSIYGEPTGLPPLLKYWKTEKGKEVDYYGQRNLEELQKNVYRAIAYLNATEHTDVLREIFEKYDRFDLSEFYWTIRIMSGDEIVKLRKEVRTKAGGIDNLR